MATIASLGIALTANSSSLVTGLTQAERRTQQYARRSQTSLNRVGRAFRGLRGALVGIIAGFAGRQLLQGVDQLVKLSAAAGVGFEEFQRLQFALEQTGVSSTQTASALVRSARAIDELRTSTGTAGEAIGRLGINLEDLEGLTAQESFLVITEALAGVSDGALRASLASDIFGNRLAVSLLPALDGTTASLRELGDSITPITEIDGENIEEFNDTINRLSVTFRNLVTTFSPVLNVFGQLLNSVIEVVRFIPGLSQLLGTAGLGAVLAIAVATVGRFALGIRTTSRNLLAFAIRTGEGSNALSRLSFQMARQGTLITVTNGRMMQFLVNMGAIPVVGRAAAVGVTLLSRAVTGLGVALRFVSIPFTLVLIAVEALVVAFNFGLTRSLQFVANLFLRLGNAIISAGNTIRRFIGGQIIEPFELYNLEVEEATDNTLELTATLYDAADGADAFVVAIEPLEDRLQSLLDTLFPARAEFNTFQDNLATLNEAFSTGAINVDQYNEALSALYQSILPQTTEQTSAFSDALEDAMDITEEIEQVGVNAFDGIANSLTELVTTGRTSFRSFANSILQDLIRIQIRKALAFAITGSGLGGIFGRQGGGPVNAGQAYQVGESGPELFVPQSNGTIVSNNNSSSAQNVTYNINAVDSRSFQQLVAENPAFINNVAELGRRQQGG